MGNRKKLDRVMASNTSRTATDTRAPKAEKQNAESTIIDIDPQEDYGQKQDEETRNKPKDHPSQDFAQDDGSGAQRRHKQTLQGTDPALEGNDHALHRCGPEQHGHGDQARNQIADP